MGLLYGLATLILIWWVLKFFAGSDPKKLARVAKTFGGVAALGAAGLLTLRGRMDMAMVLGGVGAWLLGWSATGPGGIRFPWGGTPAVAESPLLAVDLASDGAAKGGRVKAGSFAGRELDGLGAAEMTALMRELLARDPEGARLLQAYLHRRPPGWGEDAQRHGDAGQGGAARPGAMAQQEAYEILGLQPGAGEEAVREAHRTLMKRIHPDTGGTTGLAARVNEAKDVLLKGR
jgi:hypothetical protein